MILRGFELLIAAVFLFGAVRSLLKWSRAPFEGTSAADHAWFALFVVGRAGLWLAFAGLFLIYASIGTRGQAFVDEARQFDWYAIVLIGLAALQAVSGFMLGRRAPD